MSTILLVEDNVNLMQINYKALTMNGYDVLKAINIATCKKILKEQNVDLIVLDIMLPDGNGIELCKEIKNQYDIPILFLSALGKNETIIEGLKAGGDDYLSKPYDIDVLLARIEARIRSNKIHERIFYYANVKLDNINQTVYINGNDLLVTQKEFLVLKYLLMHIDVPVDKNVLFSQVWGCNSNCDMTALYTCISRLRKKLQDGNALVVISSKKDRYILESV